MTGYSSTPLNELIRACARSNDAAAWEEFVRRFHRLIAVVALRTARRWGHTSPDLLDDLIQDTFLKLCADRGAFLEKLQTERPDAIFGYIKVLTANLVHDHFKALNSQKRGRNITSALTDDHEITGSPGCASTGHESMERAVLIGQIDVSLRAIDTGPNGERDRRIFWLYYRVGLSASAIAAIPGITLTTKGVESTLLRLTKQIKQKLCRESVSSSAGISSENKGIRPPESL